MSSETQNALDTNTLANGIMRDVADIEVMERMLETELSSADLFKIDCAILSSLRSTKDFSRDLLEQLENGKLEEVATKPSKSIDEQIESIQQDAILGITLPLQDMFEEMTKIVIDAFN